MSSTWKAHERDVAAALGGDRRGPAVGGDEGGNTDVVHPFLDIECKLLGQPRFADLLGALDQASENGDHGMPVACVRKKRSMKTDTLVVMRIGDFSRLLARIDTGVDPAS